MRSASSFAFFSAASKSISSAATFFAPSFWVFFALSILRLAPVAADGPFLTAEAEVVRMTAGAVAAPSEDSPVASGDLGRAVPLPLALADKNGDAVLDPSTGVPVREGGLLGLLIVGLSQDEKKSSPCSAGVAVPSPAGVADTSVTTTSSGNLTQGKFIPRYQLICLLFLISGRSSLQFLFVFVCDV